MRANDSGQSVRLFSGGEPAAVMPGETGVVPPSDRVLSIEELARRFNVSTKTISRWRDHGLVAQRYVVDGRKRVGFLASAVERFVASNPMRIEPGLSKA